MIFSVNKCQSAFIEKKEMPLAVLAFISAMVCLIGKCTSIGVSIRCYRNFALINCGIFHIIFSILVIVAFMPCE